MARLSSARLFQAAGILEPVCFHAFTARLANSPAAAFAASKFVGISGFRTIAASFASDYRVDPPEGVAQLVEQRTFNP